MTGSTSAQSRAASVCGVRAVDDEARDLRGIGSQPPSAGAEPPVPLPWPGGAAMASGWPLRDLIELGVLPGTVPRARHHCRNVLREWNLSELADSTELLASEIVTNAVTAAGSVRSDYPIRMWLASDAVRVLVAVWDASPQMPARADGGVDAESGRGLLLVEAISDQWGTNATPPSGKTVWALIAL